MSSSSAHSWTFGLCPDLSHASQSSGTTIFLSMIWFPCGCWYLTDLRLCTESKFSMPVWWATVRLHLEFPQTWLVWNGSHQQHPQNKARFLTHFSLTPSFCFLNWYPLAQAGKLDTPLTTFFLTCYFKSTFEIHYSSLSPVPTFWSRISLSHPWTSFLSGQVFKKFFLHTKARWSILYTCTILLLFYLQPTSGP